MQSRRQELAPPFDPAAPAASTPAEHSPVREVWGLAQGRYGALRGVVVEDTGSAIRLEGRVPSHYLKQVALAVVCQAAGSRPVINRIVVGPSLPRPNPNPAPAPL